MSCAWGTGRRRRTGGNVGQARPAPPSISFCRLPSGVHIKGPIWRGGAVVCACFVCGVSCASCVFLGYVRGWLLRELARPQTCSPRPLLQPPPPTCAARAPGRCPWRCWSWRRWPSAACARGGFSVLYGWKQSSLECVCGGGGCFEAQRADEQGTGAAAPTHAAAQMCTLAAPSAIDFLTSQQSAAIALSAAFSASTRRVADGGVCGGYPRRRRRRAGGRDARRGP